MGGKLGKALYGALFTLLWPAALAAWSMALDARRVVAWPVPLPGWGGIATAVVGAGLMAVAMRSLVRDGGGLPMNAFPPVRLVTGSAYALVPHPIYVGFVLSVAGAAVVADSPSGFWLATPLSALCAWALVLGYEGRRTSERFGGAAAVPWLGLPPSGTDTVPYPARIAAVVTGFLPWGVLYALFSGVPAPLDAVELGLGFERVLPRPDAAVWLYSLAYPYALSAPLFLRRGDDLRRFVASAWLVTGVGFAVMLTVPGLNAFDTVPYGGLTGWLMDANEAIDAPWLAFPSFHVAWATLASACLATRWPRLLPLWIVLALSVAASCLLTGAHALVDLPGGAALALACWGYRGTWDTLVAACEKLGNSLTSVTLGPVRILSHAAWSGLAAAAGVLVTAALAGPGGEWAILAVFAAGIIGAGAWGYVLEGGDRLSRPFGYFGFLYGAGAAIVAFWVARPAEGAILAAAVACGAPLAQGIGRARCAVQGCCHGRPSGSVPGIRISHPMSRVTQLSRFACIPIHPTPLYSGVANAVTLVVLARLWEVGVPAPFVTGAYLVLSSLGRFVEEGFRGEPQTKTYGGLAVYQWLTAAGLLCGMAVSAMEGPVTPSVAMPSPTAIGLSILAGLVAAVAMSVDFPGSDLPLSRLTVRPSAGAPARGGEEATAP